MQCRTFWQWPKSQRVDALVGREKAENIGDAKTTAQHCVITQAKHIRQKYEMFDVNVYQENMFHTKMHLKDFDLDTYLFEAQSDDLSFKERQRIGALLRREIEELFHGRNLA